MSSLPLKQSDADLLQQMQARIDQLLLECGVLRASYLRNEQSLLAQIDVIMRERDTVLSAFGRVYLQDHEGEYKFNADTMSFESVGE